MIIEPRMRGFICLTAHPTGCAQNVINQINYVKSKGAINGPKRVLVIGASTGFGLAGPGACRSRLPITSSLLLKPLDVPMFRLAHARPQHVQDQENPSPQNR